MRAERCQLYGDRSNRQDGGIVSLHFQTLTMHDIESLPDLQLLPIPGRQRIATLLGDVGLARAMISLSIEATARSSWRPLVLVLLNQYIGARLVFYEACVTNSSNCNAHRLVQLLTFTYVDASPNAARDSKRSSVRHAAYEIRSASLWRRKYTCNRACNISARLV